MEITKFDYLSHFISVPVEVSIRDEEEMDQAPFIRKIITKLELCPEQTHLRIYFEHQKFFAVPLTSEVTISGDAWEAIDSQQSLKYVIRRVREV